MIEIGRQIIEKIGDWSISRNVFSRGDVATFVVERDIGSSKEISLFKMFKRKGSLENSQAVLKKLESMITDKGYRNILAFREGFVDAIEESTYICVRMEYAEPVIALEYDDQLIDIGKAICKAVNEWDYTKNFELEVKPQDVYKDQRGNYKVDVLDESILDYIEFGKKREVGSYSAPEVYKGQMHEESARVYSVGITLYEIANNGVLPFLSKKKENCSVEELERALNKCMLGEEMDMPSNISDSLGKIILSACSYNIADRYSTVIELADALQKNNQGKKAAGGGEIGETNKLFSGASAQAKKKKNKVLWIIVILVLLIGAGVGGFFIWKAVNVKIEVPDLKDMTYEQAKALVVASGLQMQEYTGELGENYFVESQIPTAHLSVKKKTVVSVQMYELKKDVVVPDVVGNDEEQAKNTLTDVGLVFKREYRNDDVEKGKVISSTPEAGQTVKEGDSITLVISQGKEQVTVPELVGENKKNIEAIMEGSGLEYKIKEVYDDNEKKGIVISQDVKGGTMVDKGTVLVIQVSKGPKPEEKTTAAPTPQAVAPSGGGGGSNNATEKKTTKKKKKESDWIFD